MKKAGRPKSRRGKPKRHSMLEIAGHKMYGCRVYFWRNNLGAKIICDGMK